MKNATVALLALLLFCSLPATTVLASVPAAGQVTNDAGLVETDGTTNRLELDGDARREYVSPGGDMGSALAVADGELRVDQERFVVGYEFSGATEEERQERIEAALDRVDHRIRAIDEREQRAVERHANGEISDTTLIQIVVANYNEAGALSDMLDELDDRSRTVSGYTIREEIREENRRLDRYRGPLRAYLDTTSRERGTVDSGHVVVETQANGYRLSTIRGSTYVYETARFDNRDETRSDQFDGLTAASNYAEELYPWAYETGTGSNFAAMFSYGLYRSQVSHDQGTLDAYFDGGTRAVTYETQELSVDELPASSAGQTWTNDSLTLSLNETPANGPVEVTVVDSQSDEPVDATVAVNGTVVGDTGDDGTRWIVPPTDEYELAVEANDGSVNATVAPG